MKNRLKNFGAFCWQILTEVPGWPEAPRSLRFRRLLPIAIPVAAILLLALWTVTWRNPHIRAARTAHQPLIALEQEVADLRLSYSDQQVAETTDRAKAAGKILLDDPSQLAATLDKVKGTATGFGWALTLTPTTPPTPPSASEAQVYFLPAKGKLLSAPENTQPFASLLSLLEKLPASDRWVDLTRLNLRADEQGRHSVEIFLRVGCRVPHEKAPQ